MDDFNLQVVGLVKILRTILPKLKMGGDAAIVFFSTVAVQNGFPFHAQVSASKGAIEGLTKALAPGIRVNAVALSIVDTPLASRLLSTNDKKEKNANRHPLKRIGSPADIASLASKAVGLPAR